ncbi:beta-lactamase/transpeptidase-like protein [Mycena rebaudengoi]|nr:beta-lactamase/transpeptidase-like protein [Mycena rebaudengoi]
MTWTLLLWCALAWASQVPFQRPLATSKRLITPEIDTFSRSCARTPAPAAWQVEFGAYGTAQADGAPVTPDTLFAIASNSKLFLALSVGLLIKNDSLAQARGSTLRWDTKIHTLLPEWALMDEDTANAVMIQDMLSHRTGLSRHDYSGQARPGGVAKMISTLRFLRPSAALREQYQYNNLMYEMLSHLHPTLLNQSFEAYVAEHMFSPLGMLTSTYSVAEAEARGTLAHVFHWSMEDQLYGRNGTRTATVPYFQRPGEETISAGAAGVLTSARDLHPETNETVIPEDVLEHVTSGVSDASLKSDYPELSPKVYGCGQQMFSYHGHQFIEHGGSNPGFKTQVTRLPKDNLDLIVLSNDENGNRIMESVKYRIIDTVLGLAPPVDWIGRYAEERAKGIRENQDVTPRPAPSVLPAVPFADMEGAFTHGAYGDFRPCFVVAHKTGLSEGCTRVIKGRVVQRILGASDATVPTFVVPFRRSFSTHLRLAHFAGSIFNASLVWTNGDVRAEEGLGTDGDVVIGLDDRYVAEWVQGATRGEDGWAFSGNFLGKQGEVRALEGEGREKAEVWFGRV